MATADTPVLSRSFDEDVVSWTNETITFLGRFLPAQDASPLNEIPFYQVTTPTGRVVLNTFRGFAFYETRLKTVFEVGAVPQGEWSNTSAGNPNFILAFSETQEGQSLFVPLGNAFTRIGDNAYEAAFCGTVQGNFRFVRVYVQFGSGQPNRLAIRFRGQL